MKKLIAIILAAILTLSIVACGKKENIKPTESTATNSDSTENDKMYRLGDSVETDILKFTLENAQLAIKLKASGWATYEEEQQGIVHIGSDYFTADDYDASEDLGDAYVAAKGHTYVVMQFYAENLDRTSLSFNEGFDKFIKVEYNGKTYSDGYTTQQIKYGAKSNDGLEWEKYNYSNVFLSAGENAHMRGYFDIPIDAEDLNDDFNLTFSLPTSNETTVDYHYQVLYTDRKKIEEAEISLDKAIYEFTSSEAQEYFTKHVGEFKALNANQITKNIIGKTWDTTMIVGEHAFWSGKFEFESSGAICETILGLSGYANNRTWSLKGNSLVLDGTDICKVYNVKENVYVLYKDGAPYTLLQKKVLTR